MKHNRSRVIGISVLLLAIIIAAGYIYLGNNSGTRSQLTGNEVGAEVATRPVLGAIIENTPAARPQTGLNNAGLVFEAVTEGGITRYLAFYQEDQPEIIGPVRSLRVDTLDWAMGFDSSFAHVGGRPEALELAEERNAKTLSQFIYPDPYYRDNARVAPHNVYARNEGLRGLQNELGHNQSNFDAIPRSEDNPGENPEATNITIDFSGPDYLTEFRYDESSNSYTRYLAGSPHISADAESPITVKNLIVITLPADRTTDDGALGENEALVFKDGKVIEASWEKQDYSDRIKILNKNNGEEIPLNRGKTWISALQADRAVSY